MSTRSDYGPGMTASPTRRDRIVATVRERVLAPLRRTFGHETRTGHQWQETAEQAPVAPTDADR